MAIASSIERIRLRIFPEVSVREGFASYA